MIQRSTFGQTTRTFLSDLHANSRAIDRVQHQVSTGKRITAPSDDPVGIAQALRLRQDQASMAAWRANIDDSLTWLQATETALDGKTQIIQRVRELAVQGANGTLSAADRATLAKEVRELRTQMVEIGNSALAGRHLFAGTGTLARPFGPALPNASANASGIAREVGQGETVTVNTTPAEFMGPGGATPDIFATLDALATALETSDLAGIARQMTDLDTHLGQTSDVRGGIAGRVNRLETALERFTSVELATMDQLSKVEDVDRAGAITDLKMRESALRASLGVGGRVLQPSLLDFLR
jgi:flagellar hook-associated protein 3 FlgL